jgi:beta-glucosidase-like glycosyl hydrolase
VALVDSTGRIVGQGAGASSDIYLRAVTLSPGRYVIRAADSSGGQVEAAITVTTAAAPTPEGYADLTDAEVRAAAQAADLAREHGETWAFEAEQILAAAPAQGLDRESVYELIESYGAP